MIDTELDLLQETETPARRGFSTGSIFLLVAILVAAVIFGIQLLRQNQLQPDTGFAPDFTMPLYGGGDFRLSDQRGNIVLINFWGSWCGPCRAEAPELQALWEAYQDKNVLIIGVDYLDTEARGLAFIEEFGLTYPNGPDLETRISDLYNIRGAPETFIIDQNGQVVEFIYGQVRYNNVSAIFDELLATGGA